MRKSIMIAVVVLIIVLTIPMSCWAGDRIVTANETINTSYLHVTGNLEVRQGATLEIATNTVIEVDGNIRIEGTVISTKTSTITATLKAKEIRVIGSIDFSGKNGEPGTDGESGQDGGRGGDGLDGHHLTLDASDCIYVLGRIAVSGGDGGKGGNGGKDPLGPWGPGAGGDGGNAGDAGKICMYATNFIYAYENISKIILSAGKGGEGGEPGDDGWISNEPIYGQAGTMGNITLVSEFVTTVFVSEKYIKTFDDLKVYLECNDADGDFPTPIFKYDKATPAVPQLKDNVSTYYVNSTRPTIEVMVPSDGGFTYLDRQYVSGVRKILVDCGGADPVEVIVPYEASSVLVELPQMTEGSHSIRLKAVDNAENASSYTTKILVIDTTPPQANLSLSALYTGIRAEWSVVDSNFDYCCIYYNDTDSFATAASYISRSSSYYLDTQEYNKRKYLWFRFYDKSGNYTQYTENIVTETVIIDFNSNTTAGGDKANGYWVQVSFPAMGTEVYKYRLELFKYNEDSSETIVATKELMHTAITEGYEENHYELLYLNSSTAAHDRIYGRVITYNSDLKERVGNSRYLIQLPNNMPVVNSDLFYPLNDATFNQYTALEDLYLQVQSSDADEDALTYKIYLDATRPVNEVCASGFVKKYQFGSLSDLREGVHFWQFIVSDGYNTISSQIYFFYVDYTPPALVTVNSPEAVSQTTLNIILGQISQVESLKVSYDGSVNCVPLDVVSPQTLTLPDQEGQHTVTIFAADAAGNWNAGTTFAVILDQTPPPPVSTQQITVNAQSESLSVEWPVQTDLSPGGVTPSGIAQYEVKYKNSATGEESSSGFITGTGYTIPNLSPNQKLVIQVGVIDKAGNSSYSNSIVSYTKPEQATITATRRPLDPAHPNTFPIQLNIIPGACASYDIIRYEGDAMTPTVIATSLPPTVRQIIDYPATARATYHYKVVTKNPAGNTAESGLNSITLTNYAPTVSVTTSGFLKVTDRPLLRAAITDADDTSMESITFTIYRYAADGTKSVYATNRDPQYTDPATYQPLAIEDGKYECSVTVSDGIDTGTAFADFYIDTTPPVVTCTPASIPDYVTSQTITVSDTDGPAYCASGRKSLTYYWGTDINQMFPVAGTIEVPQGEAMLNIVAEDYNGNSCTYTFGPYKVDQTPPEVSNITVDGVLVNNQHYTLNDIIVRWQDTEDETAIVKDYWVIVPAAEAGSIASLPVSAWQKRDSAGMSNSIILHDGLVDGEAYVIGLRVENSPGLLSAPISTPPVIVDRSAPVISFTDPLGTIPASYKISNLAQLTLTAVISEPHTMLDTVEYALVDSPNANLQAINTWSQAVNPINPSQLVNGQSYYLAVRGKNILGSSEESICPTSIYFDATAPTILSVVTGQPAPGATVYEQRETDRLKITWSITDESELSQLRVKIGTTAGGSQISSQMNGNQNGWVQLPLSYTGQTTLTGMQFVNQQYYLTMEATNGVGLVTTAPVNFRVNPALPETPTVTDDGFYTTMNNSLHFTVTFAEPLSTYKYQLTNAQGEPLHADWVVLPYDPALNSQSITITMLGNNPLALQNGQVYYVKVQGVDASGQETGSGYSDGIMIDCTTPVVNFPEGNYNAPDPFFSWTASDPESAIAQIELAIGSTRGATDRTNGWVLVTGSAYRFATNFLTPGQTYYATLKVRNGAGLETRIEGDGFIVDATAPPVPNVTPLSLFVNREAQMEYNWQFTLPDPESGLLKYQYALVTAQSWNDVCWQDFADPVTTAMAFSTANLVDGQVYYLALRAINGAGMTSDVFSAGVMFDEQCPTSPVITQPEYQSSTTTLTATFSALDWGSGLYGYSYSIHTYPLNDPTQRIQVTEPEQLEPGKNSLTKNLALLPGNIYYFTVTATDQAGNLSALATSRGVLIDPSGGPTLGVIQDAGQYTWDNTQLTFSWNGSYTYTPVDKYQYALSHSTTKPADHAFADVSVPMVTITANEFDHARTTFVEGAANPYYLHVKAIDWWGRVAYAVSNGIVIDSTPPSDPVVIENATFVGTSMNLQWTGSSDGQTGIKRYQYALGTVRGGDDLTHGWCDSLTTSVAYSNPSLAHNQRIYLKVRAENNTGNYSNTAYGNGVVIDKMAPTTPVVTAPAYLGDRDALSIKITSRDEQVAIQGYSYAAYRGVELLTEKTQLLALPVAAMDEYAVSVPDPGLVDGQQYTIRVKTRDASGNWSSEGVSNAILADFTQPSLSYTNTTTQVTNDGKATILWNASEAGTAYYRIKCANNQYDPAQGYYEQAVLAAGAQQLSITVPAVGTHQLQMHMVDLAGNRSDGEYIAKNIRYNAPPTITFPVPSGLTEYLGRQVEFPNPLIYDADGVQGQTYTYQWDFGDGEPLAAVAAPLHVYESTGTFTVTLMVTDVDGGSSTAALPVVITNTWGGELHRPETWSGEVTLVDEVTVPANVTLTILPGTIIRFVNDTGLKIYGRFIANGTAEQPVTFTATGGTGLWNGIYLAAGSEQSQMSRIVVERAKRGLTLHNQSLTVSYSVFRENEIGVHIYGGFPTITYSVFTNNLHYGIKEDGVTLPVITFNNFSNNAIAPYYHKVRTLLEVDAMNVVDCWTGNMSQ